MNASWDGQDLLKPITAEKPCGENLEDKPLLTAFDAFRLFGEGKPPDVPPNPPGNWRPPDWANIRASALEALGKSKDLRLLAHLGAALLRTEGLPAFLSTLTVASQWLDTYWGDVFPLVDEDAVLRRNALNCFGDQMAIVDGLRRLPLVRSRQHGNPSLRDIEIAAGDIPPGESENRPDDKQIAAAFASAPIADLNVLLSDVTGGSAALKRIDARMRNEAGLDAAPSFDLLSAQLGKVERALRGQLAVHPGRAADADGAQPDAGTGSTDAPALGVGVVKSRQDAIRALDAVAEFFRRTEPSSPIPLLVDRAKRLVSKDFLEVLADVVPDAVPQARAVGGLKPSE